MSVEAASRARALAHSCGERHEPEQSSGRVEAAGHARGRLRTHAASATTRNKVPGEWKQRAMRCKETREENFCHADALSPENRNL